MLIHLRKIAISLTAFLLVTLVGCGTMEGSQGDNTNGESVEKEMSTTIDHVSTYHYQLAIENNTDKDKTLTFPSSQDYDYSIKDKDGTILYTYSTDKMFLTVVEEEVLAPGDKLKYDLDLSEALPFIDPGEYTLDAWITATDVEENKVSIDFNYE